MSEFSRRVDVRIIKDEPMTREQWRIEDGVSEAETNPEYIALAEQQYADYVEHFQPYRFHAKGANFEIVAYGEDYLHEDGAINAVELLFGDDTTMYWAREYGEDRGLNLLRYGVTDRNAQAGVTDRLDPPQHYPAEPPL